MFSVFDSEFIGNKCKVASFLIPLKGTTRPAYQKSTLEVDAVIIDQLQDCSCNVMYIQPRRNKQPLKLCILCAELAFVYFHTYTLIWPFWAPILINLYMEHDSCPSGCQYVEHLCHYLNMSLLNS